MANTQKVSICGILALGLLTLLAACATNSAPFTSTQDVQTINGGGYAPGAVGQVAVFTNDELPNNGLYPKFGQAMEHIQNMGVDCQDQTAAQVNLQSSSQAGVDELIGKCVADSWVDLVIKDPQDNLGIHVEPLPAGVQKNENWQPPDLSQTVVTPPPNPDGN